MPPSTRTGLPDRPLKTWLNCAGVPPSALKTGVDTAPLDELVDRLERHNPERTFAVLENQTRAKPDPHPCSTTDGRSN